MAVTHYPAAGDSVVRASRSVTGRLEAEAGGVKFAPSRIQGLTYAQIVAGYPPADFVGATANPIDRNKMRYLAEPDAWRPDGEGVLYRLLTPGEQQSTPGTTTKQKVVAQVTVPMDCLSKDGDTIRLAWSAEKNGITDNAFLLVHAGATGTTGTDVNVSSTSTTILSGATDSAAGYLEYRRINATTLRRTLGGALVTSAVGNSSANPPADFTVPNMSTGDTIITVGMYTATGGGLASKEIVTLRDFEVVVRPFA